MAGLVISGKRSVIVGLALVHEALTVAVHLKERLRTRVELLHGTGELAPAEGLGVLDITTVYPRLNNAAVKQHGRAFLVDISAGPNSCADSIAVRTRAIAGGSSDGRTKRVKLKHHARIARITATSEQHTLGRIDANEVIVFLILSDDASYAAIGVLLQLDHGGVKVHRRASLLAHLGKNPQTRDTLRRIGGVPEVLHLREHVVGIFLSALCRPRGLLSRRDSNGSLIRIGRQNARYKRLHIGGLVHPHLHNSLVALAACIAADLRQELLVVHGHSAGSRGIGGIYDTVPTAYVLRA